MANLTQKNTMLVKEECISYNKMEKIHVRHTKLYNSPTILLFTALQSILTPVRMSFLGAANGWGKQKGPSLKSVTHTLH